MIGMSNFQLRVEIGMMIKRKENDGDTHFC